MSALLDRLADLPRPVKSTLLVVAGAMPMAVLAFLGGIDLKLLGIVLAGVLVVVVLLLAYGLLLRVLRDRKAKLFEGEIKRRAATVPQGVTQPAERARLDDLRKKFESGLSRFRVAGRDLYSVPWFLIIGEPGAGKTEAIRHSGIRFPEGLQDEMQGAGGTYNMDWWFTDEAVILDTAGRMVFGGAKSVDSREWSDFLKMIHRHRRRCPINGLLVAIPIDSLTRDDQTTLESKAKKLSSQLDVIQKTLDVRFPVFLMITMADKLTGFRPFFSRLRGPAALGQILGWSNPEPLDEPFDPASIGGLVQTIRDQLTRRRLSLLQDPVASETLATRRTDEIDELYGFLESVDEIVPRLQCYLEYLFVRGPWSAKAALLRGIYFTSSMQEGEALDLVLANALGVEVDSLHENGAWYEERAYFLKDLFVDKIFKEPGLVFPANANARRRQRQRRLVMSGVALVAGLAVLVATIWGVRDLKQRIGTHVDYWTSAEKVDRRDLRLVRDGLYKGGKDIGEGTYQADRVHWLSRMAEKANEKIEINPVFMLSRATDPLDATAAARRVFEVALLQPTALEAWPEKPAEKRDAEKRDAPRWNDDDTNAMASFLRMLVNEEVDTSDVGGEAGIDVGALLRAPLEGSDRPGNEDVADLVEAMRSLGSEDRWPLEATLQQDCLDAAKRGRKALQAHYQALRDGKDGPLRDALAELALVQEFLDLESELIAEGGKSRPDTSRWQQKFAALKIAFDALLLETPAPSEGGPASSAAEPDAKPGADRFDKAYEEVKRSVAGTYRGLLEVAGHTIPDVSAAREKRSSWPADSVERPADAVARALLVDWVDLDEMDEPPIWGQKQRLVEELQRDVDRDGRWVTRIQGRFGIYQGVDEFLKPDATVARFGTTEDRLRECEPVQASLDGLEGGKKASAANILQSARAAIIKEFEDYLVAGSLTDAVQRQAQAKAGAESADKIDLPLLELDPVKQAQFDPGVFGLMKADRSAVGEAGLSEEAKGLLDQYKHEYTRFWTGKVECFKEADAGLGWKKLPSELAGEDFHAGVDRLQGFAADALKEVGLSPPGGDASESSVRQKWAGLGGGSIAAFVKVLGDQASYFTSFGGDPPSLVDRYWERVTELAMQRLVAAVEDEVDDLLDGSPGFPLTEEGAALEPAALDDRWNKLSNIWSSCEASGKRAQTACRSIFTGARKQKVKFLRSLIDNLKGPTVTVIDTPGDAGESDWTHVWSEYSINGRGGGLVNRPDVPVGLAGPLSIEMKAPDKQVFEERDWGVLRLINDQIDDIEEPRKVWEVKLDIDHQGSYFVWIKVVFKTPLEPRR